MQNWQKYLLIELAVKHLFGKIPDRLFFGPLKGEGAPDAESKQRALMYAKGFGQDEDFYRATSHDLVQRPDGKWYILLCGCQEFTPEYVVGEHPLAFAADTIRSTTCDFTDPNTFLKLTAISLRWDAGKLPTYLAFDLHRRELPTPEFVKEIVGKAKATFGTDEVRVRNHHETKRNVELLVNKPKTLLLAFEGYPLVEATDGRSYRRQVHFRTED